VSSTVTGPADGWRTSGVRRRKPRVRVKVMMIEWTAVEID
jgi:hypothetical protein